MPVVDFMPSRISPSAIIGTAPTPVIAQGVSAPPAQFVAMDGTTGTVSSPILAGEPTAPLATSNC
jgi:hypothetical protein